MEDLLFTFLERYVPLTSEEKAGILALDVFRSPRKGEVLLREGQFSEEGYFVLKGCLRKYYVVDGEEKTTDFFTERQGLTPTTVQSKAPSTYYVSCVEDSLITASVPSMEAEIFAKFPKFEKLCRLLSEELLNKQELRFDAFKTSSPEQRYLMVQAQRADLLQRVPQHQLASYLGITPQSLSRLRGRLAEKNRKLA